MNLPRHEASPHIEHNDHKSYYLEISEFIRKVEDRGSFKDEDSKQRSIETNEIWEIQWYPDYPCSFYSVFAPTLEEAAAFACAVQDEVDATTK